MANDPKGPQKTIMGWGAQVPGQPQQWQPPGAPAQPPPQQQAWPQPAPPQQSWPEPAPPPQAWPQQPAMPAPPQQQPWPQAAQPQQAWQPPVGAPPWQPPVQPPIMPPGPPMPSAQPYQPEATRGVSARVRFIRLTYLHLFGAILAFIAFEYLLFTVPVLRDKVSAPLVRFALGGRANWGIVLAVFTGMSIGTHWLAQHTTAKPLHYVGLVLYVLAEALIFVPLLAIVQMETAEIIARGGGNPNIIRDAAIITLGVFGALTATVVFTKKDFSFLRSALIVGGAAAMGLIVLSLVFGFNLGIVFAIAMVLLAAGQILYETSQIVAHEDPEAYVGAALSLFSSIALLFWYVIQIVMKLRE